ncbi:MAG: hypothetical protein HYT81_10765, partial [Gemmatimonadetes bacterium]|nr:hypothetical protein [Gemmatimonadota bacterium]
MSRGTWVTGIDRLLAQRARAELERASGGDGDPEPAGHAVAAIVLAVASFEAHVGEWLALPGNRATFTPDELDALRWKPGYKIALTILKKRNAGKSYSSDGWYRRLRGLYQLRHHVAHVSAERRDTETFPPRLAPYIADGTFKPAGDVGTDWTSRLI